MPLGSNRLSLVTLLRKISSEFVDNFSIYPAERQTNEGENITSLLAEVTSCRRAAATICPAPLLPPWALKRLAPPSRRQHSCSFTQPTRSHAHRCSCLTRQHGGEQSDLVTLTFDLLTLKVVFTSRVTWATSVPIFVFLGLSVLDLGPMYATDRQTDVRLQTASSLNVPSY